MRNPILPGFHPDASAVQVGQDYYIATSTFEWWPGIDIYHSKDLVNWEWCAAPIAASDQVPSALMGNYNSGSLWAPHLSWTDGLFWLVYTDVKSATAFKDTLNHVISAPSIEGPWSKPSLITASGFDPALFHDDDGRHYFLNMLFDWRLDRPGFAGTVIQEFDPKSRTLIGERKHFYRGTRLGLCEGPQILKRPDIITFCARQVGPVMNTPPPWPGPNPWTVLGRSPPIFLLSQPRMTRQIHCKKADTPVF